MEYQLFSVQTDRSILIDALEFQDDALAGPFSRRSKGLFISIDAARKIAVAAIGRFGAALLRNLCVVRQRDSLPIASPAAVERNLLHSPSLCLK